MSAEFVAIIVLSSIVLLGIIVASLSLLKIYRRLGRTQAPPTRASSSDTKQQARYDEMLRVRQERFDASLKEKEARNLQLWWANMELEAENGRLKDALSDAHARLAHAARAAPYAAAPALPPPRSPPPPSPVAPPITQDERLRRHADRVVL